MTDEVAKASGFESAAAFYTDVERIRGEVEHGDLSPTDARRALLATEIVFGSDVIGAGVEWEIVTGMSDGETLRRLRGLQRKLIEFYAPREVTERTQWYIEGEHEGLTDLGEVFEGIRSALDRPERFSSETLTALAQEIEAAARRYGVYEPLD
jgi:hypothetical protein